MTHIIDVIIFANTVKKHFSYLETTYGFTITRAENSELHPQTDGVVEYTSDTTVIVIDSETGNAALWFYRIKDGRKYDLDPVAIDEYLNTTDTEKELLLSTNPKDRPAASTLFNRTSLLNQPGWQSGSETSEERLNRHLKNYSNWLKMHADLCLKGDFASWPKFFEYKIQRARASHLRLGKDELGYAPVKDADGKTKLIKQSIFKDKLDYVERLRKEFSG
jgi:hypothetical protein